MPDDAIDGLHDVGLEVVVEQVGAAAGQEPHQVVEGLLVGPAQLLDHPGDVGLVGRVVAEDVGRSGVEQRHGQLDDLLEVVLPAVVAVDVALAVAGDLLVVELLVLGQQEVVAVVHRREVGRHQQRHEAVLDQLELLDDLRPQQAQRVGERGEREPGVQLLGDRGSADEPAPLEHEHVEPRLGEVRRVRQAVVASADHDRVVGVAAGAGHHCSIRWEIGASSTVEPVLRAGL